MKNIIISLLLVLGFAFTGASLVTVDGAAASAKDQMTKALGEVNDNNTEDLGGGITKVINILLFAIGAISTIFIIIGGIRYTTSAGDQGSVKTAKDTIMYAVIGLIVAILAYALVNFVTGAFIK